AGAGGRASTGARGALGSCSLSARVGGNGSAPRRYGLQLTGGTQRACLPLPSPALAGRTFVAGRTGRLATTDSPALAGRAPEPHGSRVGTLRSPRQQPIRVVSFSDWLSDRSHVELYWPTPNAAIRNMRSQTAARFPSSL